jgi:CheY-like chemotaxis protein
MYLAPFMHDAFTDLNSPYILYADDDPDDIFLIKETLNTIYPEIILYGCDNGKQAYAFLESLKGGQLLPGSIVLDLNMPEWNGTKTLEMLKQHDTYKDIPAFIFTNSDHPVHKETALNLGAVDFITKPYRKEQLIEVCSMLASYAVQEKKIKRA